jgi:hypothetical protein
MNAWRNLRILRIVESSGYVVVVGVVEEATPDLQKVRLADSVRCGAVCDQVLAGSILGERRELMSLEVMAPFQCAMCTFISVVEFHSVMALSYL